MFRLPLISLTLLSLAPSLLAATADQWRGRTIYQVVTDRFARADGSTTAQCNTGDRVFCGGNWRGIINKLDYIQGLGADAIWISPVIEQIYGNTFNGEAYHGYWPKNYYALSPNFGSEQDLHDLVNALHSRGMYLMVDIVVNHYANWGETIQWNQFTPFNDQKYFHKKCWINWSNQNSVEQCWMGNGYVPLPDLNTEDPYVSSTLEKYIGDFVRKYNVDGLRIDAMKNIRPNFWPGFCSSAGVYCQGEVWTAEPSILCPWQQVSDGLHNYPLKEAATNAFSNPRNNLASVVNVANNLQNQCKSVGLLGSFMENHDNARMGSISKDIAFLKNTAVFNIFSGGIPIIYYGQEQVLTGAKDPNNREALWLSGFPTGGNNLYGFFKTLNQVRSTVIKKDGRFLTTNPSYSMPASNVMSIKKNGLTVLLTNAGSNSRTVNLNLDGYSAGTAVIDAVSCATLTSNRTGKLAVSVSNGMPMVLYAKNALAGSGVCNL